MSNGNDSILPKKDRQILKRICDDLQIPAEILEQMLHAEQKVYGMGRRHGIFEELEALIEQGVEHAAAMKGGPNDN